MRKTWLALMVPLALAAATPEGEAVLARATALYRNTDYAGSLRVLETVPSPTAQQWNLMGRNYFATGQLQKAEQAFRKAVALDPASSNAMLWMARTYGRKAETGIVLSAPFNAKEARKCFEKAVALDPNNREALNDLFAYYLEAPGFLGGGLDKAEGIAKRTAPLSPAEYEFDEARIAEKRNDYTAAEAHYRRAAEIVPEVGRILDLGHFLARRGRPQESDALLDRALKSAPEKPSVLYEVAKIWVESHRNLDRARTLLRHYLQATITSDDPPRQEAEKLLRAAGPGRNSGGGW